MNADPDGNAIVYCEGAFGTPNGKTAHGLVRHTRRYRVLAVIDSHHAGGDAGAILDDRPNDIPVYGNVLEAVTELRDEDRPATHLVIGLAPDGGRLSATARADVLTAIRAGLNVDAGLHDLLSEDAEVVALAAEQKVRIRDVRRPPSGSEMHFFCGKIEEVDCLKVAVLGTDSAVGKRTTAWMIVDGMGALDKRAELIGTGQTAWMQGDRYGIVLDALINDFVSGEIEHAVWSAWREQSPDVIVIEGQGSLMNPAYPGGYEILAAARPDVVVLQHAPARRDYDGFPGYEVHPLDRQIQVIELISEAPVAAITINHEGLNKSDVPRVCAEIAAQAGRPAYDVLLDGSGQLCKLLASCRPRPGRPGKDSSVTHGSSETSSGESQQRHRF